MFQYLNLHVFLTLSVCIFVLTWIACCVVRLGHSWCMHKQFMEIKSNNKLEAPERLPLVLWCLCTQLSGRKENRSVLRLWLGRGAYCKSQQLTLHIFHLLRSGNSWFFNIFRWVYTCGCQINVRVLVSYAPCPHSHIWHSLALYGRSTSAGEPEEKVSTASLWYLCTALPFPTTS